MSILEIKNLSHRFSDGKQALENISFEAGKGEFIIIAGANGCGKTTLLRHLNALLIPQKGKVIISGVSTAKDPVRARQVVGMVFQDADSQIVGETVSDDVAFGPENLKLDRAEIRTRVSDALDAVNMTGFADKHPFWLSGGEKRRVAIAGILAMKSEILVFDEPFSNLDYPGIKQVLAHIISLHKSGHTIILTTHDLEKVLAHADRLIVMESGKIVRNGRPAEAVKGIEKYGVREPYASCRGLELTSWLE